MNTDSDSDIEWTEEQPLRKFCILPRGLSVPENIDVDEGDENYVERYLKNTFNAKYDNKVPMYHFSKVDDTKWKVQRQCPCGKIECSLHIIPLETTFSGTMRHADGLLDELFMKEKVMTLEEARGWWKKRGPARISIKTKPYRVERLIMRKVSDFADIPSVYNSEVEVPEGREKQYLENFFKGKHKNNKDQFQIIEKNGKFTVKQQCECGNVDHCEHHIFPNTARLTSSFPLELHLKGKPVENLEKLFRKMPAMKYDEAVGWFIMKPIKYSVQAESARNELIIRMICDCRLPKTQVPCDACHKKLLRKCKNCEDFYPSRSFFENGLCQDCHVNEMVWCEFCQEDKRRGHLDCTPIDNQYDQSRSLSIYPPLIKTKGAEYGICPDCRKGISKNKYSTHQRSSHYLIKEGNGFTRRHPRRKCPYCNYTHPVIQLVKQHTQKHIKTKQWKCRYGCGATFRSKGIEIIHVREFHNGFGLKSECTRRAKRVGNDIKLMPKRRRVQKQFIQLENYS